MPYELQAILDKCDTGDFRILADMIKSSVAPTNDKELERDLALLEESPSSERRRAASLRIEREIRYLGSSDIAYLARHLRKHEPPGVSVDAIIRDVSRKLKVKQHLLGSLEARLERLAKGVVEKTFFKLSAEAQRELFRKAGLSEEQQKEFLARMKENKTLFFPILNTLIGPAAVATLIEGVVVSVIAQFIGREAAKQFFKQLIARFPWVGQALGPVVWGLSVGWLLVDVQGPAYRKTVPILLYLGVVALRDGAEDVEDVSPASS